MQRETPKRLLQDILKCTKSTRVSHRYPGYLRVKQQDYQQALLQLLKDEAADLIEALELRETLDDLQQRLESPAEHSAAQQLTRGILGGGAPLRLPADEFNTLAETYYRTTLRAQHLGEAFDFFKADLRQLELIETRFEETRRAALRYCLPRGQAAEIIKDLQEEIITERMSEALAWFLPGAIIMAAEVLTGLRLFWQPTVLLFLQTLWLLLFLHTGRSRVTGATVNLFVRRERI